jgi:hypothetical protein
MKFSLHLVSLFELDIFRNASQFQDQKLNIEKEKLVSVSICMVADVLVVTKVGYLQFGIPLS